MQRVAIGRALVRRPKAMLMDEPIGALDAKLREEMRAELKRLHLENGSTTIYVTHDQVEAMSLADRIAIMHEGVLQQVGTPDEVYPHPANLFVAQFVGSPVMNIVDGDGQRERRRRRSVMLGDGAATALHFPRELLAKLDGARRADGELTLGIRPEGVLRRARGDGRATCRSRRTSSSRSAPTTSSTSRSARRCCAPAPRAALSAGPATRVWAKLDPAQAHFFDTAERPRASMRGAETEHGAYQAQQASASSFGGHTALTRPRPRHRRRRVLRAARPDRRRQDHDAAPDRRARAARPPAQIAIDGEDVARLERRRARRGAGASSNTRSTRATRCARTSNSR